MPIIAPYYYLFDGIGYPDHYEPIGIPENFNVYLLCDTQNKSNICVYQDREDFADNNKRADTDVYRLYLKLSKNLLNCDKANDLFDLYDDTELHSAHETKLGSHAQKVYRIRKNDVRLYLIFFNSDIVILRLSIKLKNKISASEQKILDDRVKAIFANPPSSNLMRIS